MDKFNWGILSTAAIGVEKVIPAMQKSVQSNVLALASRSADSARAVADSLKISRAYGSYEELLADKDIHGIYNPLPNHLHVPWTIKAIEAGKHVLCEKPIALSVDEAIHLRDVAAKHPEIKVMEAFMYRFHPQWIRARQLLEEGAIGELRTIQTFFSYFNNDPKNIRNNASMGGGGLMDIGCYPISQARYLYGREPSRIIATLEIDESFGTDRVASSIMDFAGPTASFTCSMQMSPFQRTQIVGTQGRIEIEIPVNAPADSASRIWVSSGREISEETFPVCDQYTEQADVFVDAVLNNKSVPTPLADAIANMRVIEACVKSHESNSWVAID